MKWRGDSGLSDGAANYVYILGGYYDAGDNVKFGFPMAFTTTMLSWSVLEFGGKMGNDLQHAKEAIRWATDYLLKAAAYPGTLYVQVGEPSMDHKCWERPEDMDTPRSVYKIDAQNPGSDVASETAAALAAASMVFKSTDAPYSKLLLQTAVRVFALADEHRGAYSDSLASVVCPYYCSYSGYPDELLWGATWLAKATRSQKYFNYIQSNGPALGYRDNVNVLSWDQKHLGTRILLAREVLLNKVKSLGEYQGLANNFICSLLPGTSSARYSPGGLLFNGPTDQCNLQYVTSTTFLLFTYAKYLSTSKQVVTCANTRITPSKIRFIAKRQVDYILGDNPLGMSYMVGYGPKFPQHIHHRGSSLPSIYAHPNTISCNDGFNLGLYSSSPNPNVLDGAVIGGPDNNDQFRDDRNDYSLSEPATYINAPLVGSLAYLARS
ncbi:endoglucanase 1-like isoform X2 [Cryptomeria japonica]|uniref:endoglucanase 1-like isoform X2 n=1 Tax=Cryptomeria japonica TaxID=3369 RepID=UPI0027DA11EF|nr:endoglucanase 1-like isoform X2 [Cryptomeria japonica]